MTLYRKHIKLHFLGINKIKIKLFSVKGSQKGGGGVSDFGNLKKYINVLFCGWVPMVNRPVLAGTVLQAMLWLVNWISN